MVQKVRWAALLVAVVLVWPTNARSQDFGPGFNAEEYMEMMRISVQTVNDTAYSNAFEKPRHYFKGFESPEMVLDNYYELWLNHDRSSAVISIRGTTAKSESWLENIYAAMLPAEGVLTMGDNRKFPYKVANHPDAAVHAGWLVGMAYIARMLLPQMQDMYNRNFRNFYFVGHSQGGAIAYLLNAHFQHLQRDGQIPDDFRIKTYCSAAPKPGNLYFAYDYEAMTQNGWAFNVVNTADWVPEVPLSIQTLDDFNATNPFLHIDELIKSQKLPARIVARHIYKKLDKPTRKAQKNYQKYLGELTEAMVKKKIDGLEVPEYVPTNNYVRTGTTIVLQPDADYWAEFPEDHKKIFNHHHHKPYLFLAERMGKPFYEE